MNMHSICDHNDDAAAVSPQQKKDSWGKGGRGDIMVDPLSLSESTAFMYIVYR